VDKSTTTGTQLDNHKQIYARGNSTEMAGLMTGWYCVLLHYMEWLVWIWAKEKLQTFL